MQAVLLQPQAGSVMTWMASRACLQHLLMYLHAQALPALQSICNEGGYDDDNDD